MLQGGSLNNQTVFKAVGVAFAKINFRLIVEGLYSNSYHRLSMLTARLRFADTLRLEADYAKSDKSQIICKSSMAELFDSEKNLVSRGANFIINHSIISDPVSLSFSLEKRIPLGGGLGGGSSDCAIAMRLTELYLEGLGVKGPLLVHLNDQRLDRRQATLQQVARQLGADVPFFLDCQPSGVSWVRGIGEEVLPLKSFDIRGTPVALVCPPWGIATSEVFAESRRRFLRSERDNDKISLISSYEQLISLVKNDLTEISWVVEPRQQILHKRLEGLEDAGAVGMSGSGSTLFVLPKRQNERLPIKELRDIAQHFGAKIYFTDIL